jgi:imidazolonepropionase
MTDLDCVVYNAAELVVGPSLESPQRGVPDRLGTTTSGDQHPGANGPPSDPNTVLHRIEDGAVAVADGTVVGIGPTDELVRDYSPTAATDQIDASGKSVIPGFVDSHTHAVFAGDRSDEFADKLRGKSYQAIMDEGGGILRTVRATRQASEDTLLADLLNRLDRMLASGATTVEVKSGYGLNSETERRILDVICSASEIHPVRVVPTFMGAHAVPDEFDSAHAYIDHVLDEQLPEIANRAVFCDVFCESDVFSVEDSRRLLEQAADAGFVPKVHAEEFEHFGGSQLAADIDAVSADHLLQATTEDAAALSSAGVVPTLLPGTAFALGTDYADPRRFLRAGSEIAVASDFNPNCYASGMSFAATLASVGMGLSPAESIRACSYGGGLALGANDDRVPDSVVPPGTGTLQTGAPGDMLVLDAPSFAHVPYRFDEPTVESAIVGGEIVYTHTSDVRRTRP